MWGSGLGSHNGSGPYALVPTKTSGWWFHWLGSSPFVLKTFSGVEGFVCRFRDVVYTSSAVLRAALVSLAAQTPPSWWIRNTSCDHVRFFFPCRGACVGVLSLVGTGGFSYVPPLEPWRARHSVRPSATLAPGEGDLFVRFCWLFLRSSPTTGSLANIYYYITSFLCPT